MDCARIDLIAYHFGTLDDGGRQDAEKHLLVCSGCLKSYLALKRHTDDKGRALVPSDATRARLRKDVARAFPRPTAARGMGWLSRPIPLYQGLAAATLALLLAAFAPVALQRARAASLALGDPVDTSRSSAESLTIY